MAIKEKIKKILDGLNEGIFEKEEVIRLSLLSAIAGESIFLLGLPGVAKSLIARRLKFAFKDAKSFEYLMNRFSTPDEIFGPVSVIELQKDNYMRITEGYLPESEIVFLDEIWKAGPSIQNTLLTVLNEKIFRNGKETKAVPLLGLIAASNELPADEEGLEALWDRFLIRYIVSGVEDKDKFNQMISQDLNPEKINLKEKISKEEYKKWNTEINKILIPDEVYKVIEVIRKKIQEYNTKLDENQIEIYISDRRWKKIIKILRTSAFLNDRIEVDLMDCFLIQHCIWNNDSDITKVKDIVTESIREYGYIFEINITDLENEIKSLNQEIEKETKVEKNVKVEVFKKYHNNFYKLNGLNTYPQYSWIKEEDFKKINSSQTSYNMHDMNGNYARSMTICKENNQIKVADHNWSVCSVETTTEEKIEIEMKKPNPRLIAEFDKVIKRIILSIQNEIEKVEKFKKLKSESLETNIFISKNFAEVIYEKLNERINQFKNSILEVEKIQAYYHGIE